MPLGRKARQSCRFCSDNSSIDSDESKRAFPSESALFYFSHLMLGD
jgi:hypothetical protein